MSGFKELAKITPLSAREPFKHLMPTAEPIELFCLEDKLKKSIGVK